MTAITHTVLELSQYRIIGAPFASYSDPFYGFSEKSLFMPDSPGTFMKASLEMHALITSPSERFGISMCSMVLQKQQIKNVKPRPPFILVQTEETICIAIFLF